MAEVRPESDGGAVVTVSNCKLSTVDPVVRVAQVDEQLGLSVL